MYSASDALSHYLFEDEKIDFYKEWRYINLRDILIGIFLIIIGFILFGGSLGFALILSGIFIIIIFGTIVETLLVTDRRLLHLVSNRISAATSHFNFEHITAIETVTGLKIRKKLLGLGILLIFLGLSSFRVPIYSRLLTPMIMFILGVFLVVLSFIQRGSVVIYMDNGYIIEFRGTKEEAEKLVSEIVNKFG